MLELLDTKTKNQHMVSTTFQTNVSGRWRFLFVFATLFISVDLFVSTPFIDIPSDYTRFDNVTVSSTRSNTSTSRYKTHSCYQSHLSTFPIFVSPNTILMKWQKWTTIHCDHMSLNRISVCHHRLTSMRCLYSGTLSSCH